MHLSSGANYSPQLEQYIKTYNVLDEERDGLDFEIDDMLKQIDTRKEFKDLPENKVLRMQDIP